MRSRRGNHCCHQPQIQERSGGRAKNLFILMAVFHKVEVETVTMASASGGNVGKYTVTMASASGGNVGKY